LSAVITVGTLSTIISIIGSVLSAVITALRYLFCWGLFILILFEALYQFIPILKKINIIGILESFLADSALCDPASPTFGFLSPRGNSAYRNQGADTGGGGSPI